MPIINKGIFEGNEVFQRQVGNDWPTAQVITTSDVIEATNLYFTNARVAANVTTLMQSFQGDGIEIEANGRISANIQVSNFSETANVSNTSVFAETANVANTVLSISNFSIDALSDVDTSTSTPLDQQPLVWDEASSSWIPGIDVTVGLPQFGSLSPASTTSSFYHSIQSTTLTNDFSLSFWLYIPSDIPNGTYGLFTKIASNLLDAQLTSFVQTGSGTATIYVRNNPGNLTINMFRAFSIASSGWHYITYSYDQSSGIFYLGADGSVTNDQSFNVDWTAGDLNVYFGYRLSPGGFFSGTSTLLKFADVGLKTSLDYTTNFTPPTSHPSPGDYYFLSLAKTDGDKLVDSGTSGSNFLAYNSGADFSADNPFPASGNLTVAGFIIGDLIGTVSSISNHDTDDLSEGSNNLYFTNARVDAYINDSIDTDDISEGSNNLYFTNARVLAALEGQDINLNDVTIYGDLTVQGNTTTLNTATLVVEDKNIVLASGATDAATADGAGITIDGAGANITYRESGDKIEINKAVDVLGDLNVTGNISGNGLVIRGIEVSDAVLSGNITVEGGITGNTIAVDSITSNTWNNLYTANVIETAGNLYFTVQRARNSFTAGQNITIINGEISAETQFLTVVNDSTTITAASGNLTYGMGRSITDSRNILVIVEGLIQIPQTDYTVDGTNITFSDQPPPGANIEIRFFGAEGSSGSRPSLVASVNSFIGTGNVDYALTQSPPGKAYVTVVIDGVTQQNDAYNLTGSLVTFTEAPAVGANIDIRIVTGQVGSPYNTRTFTGDGTTDNFPITSNFTQDQILVFENGVAQVPGIDYTVSATGNVVFTTAPSANVGIQIRELSTSGPNLLSTINGLDQTTGNLVPDVDGIRSLGSSTKRFKDLYLTGNTIVLGDIALSSFDGLLEVSPVIEGNIITANAAPASFTAGDNILIEANGRISSSAATTGKAIAMSIVFGG